MNPYLGRYAKKPTALPKKGEKPKANPFRDGLLNDWGIQHFHGDDGADTTRRRSSMMLFAMVKPNDVVERVHVNWPFGDYRSRSSTPLVRRMRRSRPSRPSTPAPLFT